MDHADPLAQLATVVASGVLPHVGGADAPPTEEAPAPQASLTTGSEFTPRPPYIFIKHQPRGWCLGCARNKEIYGKHKLENENSH